jgi:hypothetical protein
VEEHIFNNVTSAKSVIVKVPNNTDWSGIISGSPYNATTAPFTDNWGNGFRGCGWDGANIVTGGLANSYITLTVQPLP